MGVFQYEDGSDTTIECLVQQPENQNIDDEVMNSDILMQECGKPSTAEFKLGKARKYIKVENKNCQEFLYMELKTKFL